MIGRIALSAALAAAPAARGQSWDFEVSNPELRPSAPSTTVTLFADVDPAEWFASSALDVQATEPGWSDPLALIAHPGQNPGVLAGAMVEGIAVGQLRVFGYLPDPGRIPVWQATFAVTDFTERTVELDTRTSQFSIYIEIMGTSWPVARRPIEGVATIKVVPAAGGLALLGMGGLLAARRRRTLRQRLQRGRTCDESAVTEVTGGTL